MMSIVGSILGNLLLVLGGAMLYGGTKYPVQKFSRTGASVNVGMLWIVLVALVVPSFVQMAYDFDRGLAVVTIIEPAEKGGQEKDGYIDKTGNFVWEPSGKFQFKMR